MGKVEFSKTWKAGFIASYLDDYSFKNDDEKLVKTLGTLKLFSLNSLSIKCSVFADEQDTFLNKIEDATNCKTEILFTKKRLFSKKTYSKVQFLLDEPSFYKVVELAIRSEQTVEFECSVGLEVVLVGVINDNNGSCINLSVNKYDADEIKAKIKEVLN